MADMARELQGYGVIEAHRAELVGQISRSLAHEGIRHNITAAKSTIKSIVASHMDLLGTNFYDPTAKWNVASVDTIIRRDQPLAARINWLFQDEGHHTLEANKWGKAAAMYPNAKVLLMTATPTRADGMGLGRHADGIADALVIGAQLGDLIRDGYLTDYKVKTVLPGDLDLAGVHIGASGEFNHQEAAAAIRKSRKIVGDVVDTYLEHARGKLGITFAVDIVEAQKITDAFNAAGVPAALVTAETPDDMTPTGRGGIMKAFKNRQLMQLVNVDLFGEGVDVPAVECVSMARPTASFSLYAQQIGRMLRLNISPILMAAWDTFTVAQRLQHIAESPKPYGMLFDHVGNVRREFNIGGYKFSGLPQWFTYWTLDRRTKRGKNSADDGIPLRICMGCHKPYERIYDACPYCGAALPEPTDRSSPEHVDGVLSDLTPEEQAKMIAAIQRVAGPVRIPQNLPPHAEASLVRKHHERQQEQFLMKEALAQWAGYYPKDSHTVNQRRFFHTFAIDAASALALPSNDAAALRGRILEEMNK